VADDDNLVLVILRELRSDMRELRDDVRVIQARLDGVDVRLARVERAVVKCVRGLRRHDDAIDDLRTRVIRLELLQGIR
jgi:hypothetical protein